MISKASTKLFFKYKADFLALSLFLFSLPLFFYKLGQSSLENWDEAWYGAIAKNILHNGQLFTLTFNNGPYTDHPPGVFWLMAATYKIFGVSEFWTRFPSATLGFLSLVIVYLLGKELFSRTVGFCSALGLCSSFWFIYRARSGNLDIPLTFFFLLTFYLAWLAAKNKKFIWPFTVSFIFLILSKTVIPFTIIPALVVIFWRIKVYKPKDLIGPILIFVVMIGGWWVIENRYKDDFSARYLMIGAPGSTLQAHVWSNFQTAKEYLHEGIGKWFWPGVLAVFGGVVFLQRRFLSLFVLCICFFTPFIFSFKGQVWHLIPLHPFLILSLFGFGWVVGEKLIKNTRVVSIILISVAVFLSFQQINRMWKQFINIPAYISDEAILAKAASSLPGTLYIQGDELGEPIASFYSDKPVRIIQTSEFVPLFGGVQPLVLLTKQKALDEAGIKPAKYSIIKSDRDKILVKND